ncbi:MAG: carboxypeptidase-like regulatory domain-containing protein [Burkholderiales bacterium]
MNTQQTISRFARTLCALIASAAAGLCTAQTSIQGTVTDTARRPVPGLTVYVANREAGRSAPAYTDQRGHYRLDGIPASSLPYGFEVYSGARVVDRRQVSLGPRGTLTIDVQLR